MKSVPGILSLILFSFSIFSCKEKPIVPIVVTVDVSAISCTSATSGVEVINDGGSLVTACGLCWNTSGAPINCKTSDVCGLGTFTIDMNQLSPNSTYTLRAYAVNSTGTGYGNTITFNTLKVVAASISTSDIISLTQTSAVIGGNITNDINGSTVTSRGICWSTEANPTISNDTTCAGTGAGSFKSKLTGLTGNTTYYVRAYATNNAGTGYGEQMSFTTLTFGQIGTVTDIDGNIYNTVALGSQIWMADNLRTTKYRNGTSIGTTPYGQFVVYESAPSYQWVAGDSWSTLETYGRYYPWLAATNNLNICPTGWHLPTDSEWRTMIEFLVDNGYNYDGSHTAPDNKLAKSMASTSGWLPSVNPGAVGNSDFPEKRNSTGFTATPAGAYNSGSGFGVSSTWWSATPSLPTMSGSKAVCWGIYYNSSAISGGPSDVKAGYSIRCVRD